MTPKIDELLAQMKALEEELEVEFDKKRDEIKFIIEDRRVRFAREVAAQQRRYKVGLLRFLAGTRPLVFLTAPFIYAVAAPLLLLDLLATLYQAVCFPVYRIPKVRRRDYFVFDRAELPYLNAIEKFNCFYCAYGLGVIAYVREIAARTEQYWCPIKHAHRVLGAHGRYPRFFEYGDAEAYRKGLERLRRLYP